MQNTVTPYKRGSTYWARVPQLDGRGVPKSVPHGGTNPEQGAIVPPEAPRDTPETPLAPYKWSYKQTPKPSGHVLAEIGPILRAGDVVMGWRFLGDTEWRVRSAPPQHQRKARGDAEATTPPLSGTLASGFLREGE